MKTNNNNTLDTLSSNRYEVIRNETLKDRHFKGLTISGSLFSQNNFCGVTFVDCVFFSTKMLRSHFRGCKFINCKFQFSGIKQCKFIASVFKDCTWETSPIQDSSFISSFLDYKTQFYASKKRNFFEECFNETILDDEEEVEKLIAA